MASFSLGRASALLASGTLVSRALGFAMALLTAYTIGVVGSPGADAFTTANLLPNTIYSIIAGGALNAVLVPQIVRAGLHADGGQTYINRLLTLALGLLLVTTVLATICAPLLVALYAPGYGFGQNRLAVAFALWCLPQILFYGLYTILGEVLNARGSFGPFTWAPVLNNVVAIGGLLLFLALFGTRADAITIRSWTPAMIAVLAGSATLGVATQALFLTFFWRRVGLRYRPDFRFRGVGLGAAGRMATWSFVTVLLSIGAGIVESAVSTGASAQGGAGPAALQKSWLIFMLPHSVIAVSIATAYFTRMSGHAARNEMGDLRRDVSAAIRTIALFMVFATTAIVVLATPLGSLFNARASDAVTMGRIIVAYAIALPLFSSLAIMQRAFYALGDGLRPFLFTLLQVVVVIAGCLLALASPADTRATSIAFATAVSIICQGLLAAVLLRAKLRGGGRTVVVRFVQYAIAAVPAAIVGNRVLALFPDTARAGVLGLIAPLAVVGASMAVVYLLALWLLRVPELRILADPLLRRFGR